MKRVRHSNSGLITTGLLVLILLVGCRSALGTDPPATTSPSPLPEGLLPVTLADLPLAQSSQPCTNTFVGQNLNHTTTVPGPVVELFESNGSGVALGDLNLDGLLDIVFANVGGPGTLLWNQGNLNFKTESLPDNNTRAVNIVDVDGDGRPDLTFTHSTTGVTYWRNTGAPPNEPRFSREPLRGVDKPAYAMTWGDLNRDGQLDLVTGSYDVELEKELRDSFLFGTGAGIFYYSHRGENFVPQRLAQKSQALAIALPDLNGDHQPDILVGNDFELPDMAWRRTETSWVTLEPFATKMSQNTMSFDLGDVNNDGQPEILATDMKPYQTDVKTMASWLPLMDYMNKHHPPQAPGQIVENVLQVRGADGRYHNEGYTRAVDATGWSWSSKFGDLNNDGFLDIYVVNGMMAADLFGYLPRNELVEANQALRNQGDGYFTPAPEWGLGSTASGRGMSLADLNNDGSLDIVVNNLQSPAQLFENRLCGGSSIEVDLVWPAGANQRAIGAQLSLHTSAGTYYRDVRVASGYLSGDPARVHFGFPAGAELQHLDIAWPDGQVSSVNSVTAQTLMTITR